MRLSQTLLFYWLAALLLSACPLHVDAQGPVVIIESEHAACAVDDDCVVIDPSCSHCGCGEPLNRTYQALYSEKLKELCASFRGPVCDVACPSFKLQCIEKRCRQVEQSRPSGSDWLGQ